MSLSNNPTPAELVKAVKDVETNKLGKTLTASQIYGTDNSGNQTTYNIDDVATNLGIWGFYANANNEYIKFMTLAPNATNDHNYLIYINRNGNQTTVFSGILNIRVRWENGGANLSHCTMYWVNKTGFGDNDIIAMYDSTNNQVVFYILSTSQREYRFKIIVKRGSGIITKNTESTSYTIATPDYTSFNNSAAITTTTGSESISDGTNTLNVVTRDTAQDITGSKTFVGSQILNFKQSSGTDKLGFTAYDTNATEIGNLQIASRSMRPIGSSSSASYNLVSLGNYTNDNATYHASQIGFRVTSDDTSSPKSYNVLAPKDTKANINALYGSTYDSIYMITALTDGTNNAFADKKGLVNISSLITSVQYTTTTPTAANTNGLKIAVLSTEPATRYSGWLYIITGS